MATKQKKTTSNKQRKAKQAAKSQNRLILVVAVLILGLSCFASYLWGRHDGQRTQTAHKPISKVIGSHPLTPLSEVTPSYDVKHDTAIPPVVNGIAPLIIQLPTKQPIVFLGIDDGGNKQAFELKLMKDNNVKASLFLSDLFIKDNRGFFKDFVTAGSLIEDHTVNHKLLSKLTYDQQKQEICDEANMQMVEFGRRPVIFRPPGGDYNLDTQRAAAACGMKAVVNWIAKANGGSMQYQIGNSLRPGDIVLMHFRPEFAADMQAFLDAEKAAGLHTELLENWLP
jgi:hypothetical protein